MALVSNLTGVFHLSKDDAKQLISDLYGINVSDGSVINIEERFAQALNSIYKQIHSFVTESIAEALIKAGADLSIQDNGCQTALAIAKSKEQEEIIDLIMKKMGQ